MKNLLINKTNDASNKQTQQNRMLKMITSYSIFLVVILILFFILYNSSIDNVRAQYKWRMHSTIMSNAELFEKDLEIMNVYCRQLLQNNDFRNLTAIDDINSEFLDLGYSLSTTLSTDVYPESLLPIKEVFCFLPGPQYILAPSYFISSDRYYDWIKRFSMEDYDNWLKVLTSSDNYYRFIPMDQFAPNHSQRYYMYIMNMDDLYYTNVDAVVCFVFEEKKLASLFDCMDTNTAYPSITITNKDNVSVLSIIDSNDAKFNELMHSDIFNISNSYLKSINVSMGAYNSKNSGLTYYYTYPSIESTSNIAHQQIMHLTLFAIALLLGLALIFVFSKRNLQPIIELGQELLEVNEEKTHLQEVMDSQRPILFNSYVRQLIKGNITSEKEAEYIKDFLEIVGDNLYYNGLYVVTYNNVDEELGNSGEFRTPQEYNSIVMDALQKYLGMPLYGYSPSDRTYAIMLVCTEEDEKDFIIKTNEIIIQLHNYLLDNYGIWLFAGIGKNTDTITNVWESYQQAVESVSYTSKNYIFFPYEFIKKDSSAFYYPTELSTKLIHFITTGNTSQVLELFNLLHQENIEERSLPINMLQFLLSDIRNTLLKARFALPQNTSKEEIAALDTYFDQHVTFKLCEDIAMRLCKLFTVETDDTSLISAIEKYIEKNYSDPSMGLNKISDEFQISESYFSHMFKEKTGVNFSNYLENIRMNEAARLIKETDIGLNELYISVGYNNANTFRRAFKKIYGVTPSSMRDPKK